jgi:septal ring factor EnvC (AmiA/AmiB activator)
MKRGFAFFVCLMITATVAAAAQKKPAPNFYADAPSSRAAGKKNSAPSQASTKKSTPAPATSGSRAAAKNSQRTPAASRQTASSKSAPKTDDDAKVIAAEKPAATTQARKYAGDIYGLAAAIQKRWNFRDMLPTQDEAVRLRLDGMQRAVERCAAAFDQVSRALEHRQSNVRNATAALYLLHASRSETPCYLATAGEVSAAQVAVLRATVLDDLANQSQLTETYREAREALNRSAEQVSAARKNSEDFTVVDASWRPSKMRAIAPAQLQRRPYAVTVDLADTAKEETISILAARVPPPDAIDAILEAERVGRNQQQRLTLASFAPAPPLPGPAYNALIDPDTPIPQDVGTSRKNKPDPAPAVEKPTERGIVLPTAQNANVLAVADGTIGFAGDVRGYGKTLIVQHDEQMFTVYSYLSRFEVSEGDHVKSGQPIAKAGTIPGTRTSGVRFDVRRGKESVPAKELLGSADPAKLLAGK